MHCTFLHICKAAVEKLKDRQEYLAKQTDVYSDKVEILKRELEEMESAENRNEDAIRKKTITVFTGVGNSIRK